MQGESTAQGKPGDSPLDKVSKAEPGAKEKAPAPGTKPPARDGSPTSPLAEPEQESQNQQGGPPPRRATERTAAPNAADRWGDLPIHTREVFLNSGRNELPPEYVDWIDAYYRRLNQLK